MSRWPAGVTFGGKWRGSGGVLCRAARRQGILRWDTTQSGPGRFKPLFRGGCHYVGMPLIQVHNASPSSTEKKRQLLAALTATYAEVMEIRPDTIRVILHELPRENWSVAGITLADSGQNESLSP